MYPKNNTDWARTLAVLLDSALMAADPESVDPEFEQHRTALDRYAFWRAERHGQQRLDLSTSRDGSNMREMLRGLTEMLSTPIAAHGCHCHEEETE